MCGKSGGECSEFVTRGNGVCEGFHKAPSGKSPAPRPPLPSRTGHGDSEATSSPPPHRAAFVREPGTKRHAGVAPEGFPAASQPRCGGNFLRPSPSPVPVYGRATGPPSELPFCDLYVLLRPFPPSDVFRYAPCGHCTTHSSPRTCNPYAFMRRLTAIAKSEKGRVAEWSKALDSKSNVVKATVGSNPTPSAILRRPVVGEERPLHEGPPGILCGFKVTY